MRKVIIAVSVLAVAGLAYCADVVLGKIGDLTFSGSGTTFVGSFAQGWSDTNAYLIYHNMLTNSLGDIADISGNSRDMSPLPNVATGPAQFEVTNSPSKYAMQFDGSDDHFDLTTITGMTNSTTGTIHIWRQRQDRPATMALGEFVMSYSVKASATQPQLRICEDEAGGGGRTNVLQVQAYGGNTAKWVWESASNKIGIEGGWSLYSIVHNGTSPSIYIDGILQSGTFITSTDLTWWTDKMTATDNITLGNLWYNNTSYYHFDGDMAIYAQLAYAQSSNDVYTFWQNTSPTNYLRIE